VSATENAVRDWCYEHRLSAEPVVEFWKERAAIREYLGNVSRWNAELAALDQDVVAKFAPEEA